MNKHILPPSNVREIGAIAPAQSTEQFIVMRGRHEAWIDGDLMDRHTVIQEVANDCETLRKIIAIDLVNGTSRDATDDITGTVIQRWAEDGKELTQKQYEFVELCRGTAFANYFRREVA